MRQHHLECVYTSLSCSIGSPEIEISYHDTCGNELLNEKATAKPSELIRKYGLDKPVFARMCREGLFSQLD